MLLQLSANGGIERSVAERGLQVRYRHVGEEIAMPGQAHRHKLKKLLQEAGVVPWMRDRIPLLYAGDRLAAIADLRIAAEFSAGGGYAVQWRDGPALY